MLTLLIACTGAKDSASVTDTSDTDTTPDASSLSCGADSPDQSTVEVNGLSLNVACQGDGPTMLMLHGFPEFWYAWGPLAGEIAGDYRVVMPDQRGYNLSDKPTELSDYTIDVLVADMVDLIGQISDEPIVLVAHDWGGIVAWYLAAQHPELLSGLVILNSPHPDVFARELAENPDQQEASSYITWFQSEGVEDVLSANDYGLLGGTVFNDAFSEADQAAYIDAWSQPGALTAMLNWYRANADASGIAIPDAPLMVTVPTLVIWGMADTALLPGNLVGLDEYVSDLTVVEYAEATHWISHEEPEAVAVDILSFAGSL
ncbi:MAG: pimeloyl-ACP methyl ester carboxylesterase [Myxococcota bacterium]|jgi:pimeloyl-ACP methyl ester carboxylesterase